MKTLLLMCAALLILTACNGNDEPPPTEIRVITSEPEQTDLEATIAAYQTRDATTDAPNNPTDSMSATPQTGVVINGDAIVFAEPDTTSQEIGILPINTTVQILDRTEADRIGVVFYNVQFETLNGWVASTQVQAAPQVAEVVPTTTPPPSSTPTTFVTQVEPTPAPTLTLPPTSTPTIAPTVLPANFPTPERYSLTVAEQLFEGGRMMWLQPLREIWVLTDDPDDPDQGTWECFIDSFIDGMPENNPALDPPDGTIPQTDFVGAIASQPVRGFGIVWRENPDVREGLGWAIVPETLHTTSYIYNAGGEVEDGEYEPAPGQIRIESFFQQTLVFFEDTVRPPCDEKSGTWEIQ